MLAGGVESVAVPFGHALSNLPELLKNFTENAPAQAPVGTGCGVRSTFGSARRVDCNAQRPVAFLRSLKIFFFELMAMSSSPVAVYGAPLAVRGGSIAVRRGGLHFCEPSKHFF